MALLGGIGGKLYRGEVSVEFVARKRLWYSISGAILAVSVIAVAVFGLNFSVDFKGGSVYQFPAGNTTITQVRQTVSGAGGGQDAIVQKTTSISNGQSSWQVQTRQLTVAQQNSVQSAISRNFHVAPASINVKSIGASWGSQISKKAAEALIAFIVVIVIYLSIAFEWKMAIAALIALAHDIVITIGVYALAHFEVSPASVIGLLTILGYSLYDTVVVFDKVRENTAGLLASTRSTYSQAANQALNQTLVRSINTSLIALLPVASILFVGAGFLGAGELKDLALVLFVGMLSGTYSSICIATPVLADLKEREPQYKALAKRVQLRASGGRAAKRAAAKASATQAAPGRAATGRAGRAEMPAPEPDLEPDLAADDADASVIDQPGEDVAEGTAAAAEPVAAGAGQPASRSGPRPGPRQQPRRTSAAKRRPSGKKRRR
jgi:preprotein translocase subunit SecF